jgi:hypothetical protein
VEKGEFESLQFPLRVTEGSVSEVEADVQAFVSDVKGEWRLLWRDRIDDKVRAEGIANREYSLLFVERGNVVIATRDFKQLDLRSIIRLHGIDDVDRVVSPHPSVGGWGKFGRDVMNRQKRARSWKEGASPKKRCGNLQLKKDGRGWLHRNGKK